MTYKTMLWIMLVTGFAIFVFSTYTIVNHIGDVPVPSDEPRIVGVADVRPVVALIGFCVFVISTILWYCVK